jgi:hypothetical protein
MDTDTKMIMPEPGDLQSCPGTTVQQQVQQPHRPATTNYDRHRRLSCLSDL